MRPTLPALSLLPLLVACQSPDPAPQPAPPQDPQPTPTAAAPTGTPEFELDLADLYLRHDRLDEARAIYARIAQASPEHTQRARYGQGLVAVKAEAFDEATGWFEKAIEATEGEGARAQLRLQLAELLRRQEKNQLAEAQIEAVLAAPDCPPALRPAAFREIAQLYRGRYPELVKKLQAHLEKHPQDTERLAFLGDVYAELLEQPAAALDTYQRLAALDTKNTVLLDRAFSLALELGDGERALQLGAQLADALEQQPQARLVVLRKLAGILVQAEEHDKALGVLGKAMTLAVAVAPQLQAELRAETFQVHKLSGNLPTLVEKLGESGALDDLYYIHTQLEPDDEAAQAVVERMLKDHPKAPKSHLCAAELGAKRQDHAQVAKACATLFELQPLAALDMAPTYAAAMAQEKRADEAVKRLRELAEAEPRIKASCLLALVALQPKQRAELIPAVVEAAQAAPEPAVCLTAARGLRAARAGKAALAVLQAGLTNPKAPGEAKLQLAWEHVLVLEAMGNLAGAEKAVRALQGEKLPAQIRQQLEQKLLGLLQRQGKSVSIKPE